MDAWNKAVEERHYIFFLAVLFAFGVGSAFFFAPIILSVNYWYVLGLLGATAALYGYFTAEFISDLDHLNKNHHVGIWMTALIGTLFGFFVMQYRLEQAGYASLLPVTGDVYFLGLVFSGLYLVSYTSVLLWEEHELE